MTPPSRDRRRARAVRHGHRPQPDVRPRRRTSSARAPTAPAATTRSTRRATSTSRSATCAGRRTATSRNSCAKVAIGVVTSTELAPIRVPIDDAPRAYEILKSPDASADRAHRLRPRGLTGVSTAAGPRRPISAEDLFKVRWLSQPRLSPDGERAAVTVTWLDRERDRIVSQVAWLGTNGYGELQSESPTAGRDQDPTWSPDGRRLAFVSDRSGRPEIWVVDTPLRSARPLTNSPTGASGPRGRRAAIGSRSSRRNRSPPARRWVRGGPLPLEGRRCRRHRPVDAAARLARTGDRRRRAEADRRRLGRRPAPLLARRADRRVPIEPHRRPGHGHDVGAVARRDGGRLAAAGRAGGRRDPDARVVAGRPPARVSRAIARARHRASTATSGSSTSRAATCATSPASSIGRWASGSAPDPPGSFLPPDLAWSPGAMPCSRSPQKAARAGSCGLASTAPSRRFLAVQSAGSASGVARWFGRDRGARRDGRRSGRTRDHGRGRVGHDDDHVGRVGMAGRNPVRAAGADRVRGAGRADPRSVAAAPGRLPPPTRRCR